MKLDKDTLVKHQFWILLGSYLLVWIIAVLWLGAAAGPEITKAQSAYKTSSDKLTAAKTNPVNPVTFLPPWQKAADTFHGHKDVIWKDAWTYQAGMYDWPDRWKNKDMTTPQTELVPDDRSDYRHKLYPQQIDLLRKNAPQYLYPVELAGGFDQVFQPQRWEETPTREEIWLAQEDFWVKRELLMVIYGEMANLAFMHPTPIGDDEKAPEGVAARHRYRNQNWEITLNLRKNKDGQLIIGGDSTIKNVDPTHRPQPLTSAKGEGIHFTVAQDRTRTDFEVKGEPVGWFETRPFGMNRDNEREDFEPLDGIRWEQMKEHPIYISQGFDRTNSPLRSIQKIALGNGTQDCRTFYWKLQPNHTLARLDAPVEEADAKKGPGGSPSPGGPGVPPRAGGPQGMGGSPGASTPPGPGANSPYGQTGAAAPTENLTPNNKIDRDRYLHPADLDKKLDPPSRHLPLALRLVVEQSHMHDVMLALANSRLRFQLTQVEFHHDRDYVPESEGEKKDSTDTGGSSRVFMGGVPGMMPRNSGGYGPGRPTGSSSSPASMYANRPGTGSSSYMMSSPPPTRTPPGMGGGRRGPGRNRPTPPTGTSTGTSTPYTSGGGNTKQALQTPQDDNLVEITLYGIATLYRRPDPPRPTEQPGQPGQPGQPAAPSGQAQPGRPASQPAAPPSPAGNKG